MVLLHALHINCSIIRMTHYVSKERQSKKTCDVT